MHTQNGIAQKFVNDVKTAVAEIMQRPDLKVEGKVSTAVVFPSDKNSFIFWAKNLRIHT